MAENSLNTRQIKTLLNLLVALFQAYHFLVSEFLGSWVVLSDPGLVGI